jgi:hypothetical protein
MNDVLETGTQQTNSLVVDMVSDLICPWCFVAKRRVEKAAAILGGKGRDALASLRAECRYASRWPRPATVPLGEVRQLGAITAARCTSRGCRRGGWNHLPSRPNETDTEHFSRSWSALLSMPPLKCDVMEEPSWRILSNSFPRR